MTEERETLMDAIDREIAEEAYNFEPTVRELALIGSGAASLRTFRKGTARFYVDEGGFREIVFVPALGEKNPEQRETWSGEDARYAAPEQLLLENRGATVSDGVRKMIAEIDAHVDQARDEYNRPAFVFVVAEVMEYEGNYSERTFSSLRDARAYAKELLPHAKELQLDIDITPTRVY